VYINLLRTQDDMVKRLGGKCYPERTHLCRSMQEDAKRVMQNAIPDVDLVRFQGWQAGYLSTWNNKW
jgi:hypothetical protein